MPGLVALRISGSRLDRKRLHVATRQPHFRARCNSAHRRVNHRPERRLLQPDGTRRRVRQTRPPRDRVPVLGVARGLGPPLALLLEVPGRPAGTRSGAIPHTAVPRVAGREHEPVPVEPLRVDRVEPQEPGPQHLGGRGQRHGRARMAVAGLLDGVHGQDTDGVDRQPVQVHLGSGQRVGRHLTSSFRVVAAGAVASVEWADGPTSCPACAWRLPVIQHEWSGDVDAFVC
jgi:hypothetical protein